MKYPTTLIIAASSCSTAAAAPEQVSCDSPCDCHDAHGEARWSVKSDASLPPTDASAIQAVTPSEMSSWRRRDTYGAKYPDLKESPLLHTAYGAARLQPAESVGPLALVP